MNGASAYRCAACGRVSEEQRSPLDRCVMGDDGERWLTYMWPYEVSDLGRVRNITRDKIIKPNVKPPGGYHAVTLRIDRTRSLDRYVHRMVLEAFVGSPQPGDHGRHLNGTPSDNRLVNLAWGTPIENKADDLRLGRRMRGSRQHRALLTEETARAIKLSDESAEVLGKRYGVHPQTIVSLRRGLSWIWVI